MGTVRGLGVSYMALSKSLLFFLVSSGVAELVHKLTKVCVCYRKHILICKLVVLRTLMSSPKVFDE